MLHRIDSFLDRGDIQEELWHTRHVSTVYPDADYWCSKTNGRRQNFIEHQTHLRD